MWLGWDAGGGGGRSVDGHVTKPWRALREMRSMPGFILRTMGSSRENGGSEHYLGAHSEMDSHMLETCSLAVRTGDKPAGGGSGVSPELILLWWAMALG